MTIGELKAYLADCPEDAIVVVLPENVSKAVEARFIEQMPGDAGTYVIWTEPVEE